MRVLVMRPAGEAVGTARRLAELGHEAVLAPLLSIVPTGARLPEGRFAAIVATSANAVAWLGCDELPPGLAGTPLFSVGARTAQAARTRGFTDLCRIEADAKSLLAAMLPVLKPGSRVLYLAGVDRKSDIESGLRKAGHFVDVVETYAALPEALPPAVVDSLVQGRIDAALHYSRRSAAIFCHSVIAAGHAAAAARLSHHCISTDAAEPLAALAASRIFTAAHADETALLATLPPCESVIDAQRF